MTALASLLVDTDDASGWEFRPPTIKNSQVVKRNELTAYDTRGRVYKRNALQQRQYKRPARSVYMVPCGIGCRHFELREWQVVSNGYASCRWEQTIHGGVYAHHPLAAAA